MYVVATAGHVDHGKSTLVHRLTGTWPDRLAEENRRGLTIELGFAWTEVPAGRLAFVDVPGHQRFVPNMLAGIGPVVAVLFVVAADEGWMAQSAEHLAALDALGVRHGLLAVTKSDRADPGPVAEAAREQLAGTSLGAVTAVAVSGRTGEGLPRLRAELDALARGLPEPDRTADVRLWVDRAFTVRGAGTVVTGTLPQGTIEVGDELLVAGEAQRVRVRGLQSLGTEVGSATAVARVAVNLRGIDPAAVGRGAALLTPGAWLTTDELDVRLRGDEPAWLPREVMLHVGSAAIPARVRALGRTTARLSLRTGLPLRVGDVGLLRDPGRHRIAAGAEVLDIRPPSLHRRGAARARAQELAHADATDLAEATLRRRGFVPAGQLRAMGLPATAGMVRHDWVADPSLWSALPARARRQMAEWQRANPLAPGMPAEALRERLGLPAARLLPEALIGTGLTLRDGLVHDPSAAPLPPAVRRAVEVLEQRLADQPFRAPEAGELAELGLGARELAAAVRAGRLTRIGDGIVLGPGVVAKALGVLAGLSQPFTVSQARKALDTTRRVAIPLLEHLDVHGHTEHLPDHTRRVMP
ncbi:selenocysteine-specific translation elongation factor [Amycolatopsis aidingensis]|uniref:selenocysteine-specific translation elongation factor n=1 Tax=Amycolatopsis aidingensis TaxID=2842453 RepID=UPI001C0C19DB|nr:selenocysteine-specific translation elongation factor [Amycolatopsis aidingensis]